MDHPSPSTLHTKFNQNPFSGFLEETGLHSIFTSNTLVNELWWYNWYVYISQEDSLMIS
jgi:hypothetical protein